MYYDDQVLPLYSIQTTINNNKQMVNFDILMKYGFHCISTYRSLYFVCRLIVNNNNNNRL